MVHHDDTLGRLTEGSGRLDAMTALSLAACVSRTADRMISVGDLCDLVAGRVTLVIELKGRFDGDRRLVARAARGAFTLCGPAALMSFDPTQIAAAANHRARPARGMVAERRYGHPAWNEVPRQQAGDDLFSDTHSARGRTSSPIRQGLPAMIPCVAAASSTCRF